jgi:hypothetical protein
MNGEGVSVVSETVESSTGQQIVVKDFGPFLEGTVAGDDQRSAFVALETAINKTSY